MGERATHDAACAQPQANAAAAGLLLAREWHTHTCTSRVTSVRLAADGRTTASPCVLHTPTPTLQPDAMW